MIPKIVKETLSFLYPFRGCKRVTDVPLGSKRDIGFPEKDVGYKGSLDNFIPE